MKIAEINFLYGVVEKCMEYKDKQVRETLIKLIDITKVNNISFLGLDKKIMSALIMAYQQGLKDAGEILKEESRRESPEQ